MRTYQGKTVAIKSAIFNGVIIGCLRFADTKRIARYAMVLNNIVAADVSLGFKGIIARAANVATGENKLRQQSPLRSSTLILL